MKKSISIIALAICLLCFTTNTFAQQPPAVKFYDQQEGTFKQDNGNLVLTINKHNYSDRIGNSSQGIQISSKTSSRKTYFARIVSNKPNKYVLPKLKTCYIEYLSNNKFKYVIPGATLTFTKTKGKVNPPTVKFFNRIEGTFQQVGSSYKVVAKKENKSTGQGVRLTPTNGGRSAYYGRVTSNQPNKYTASSNRSIYIKYINNDKFQYITPNKTLTFMRVTAKVDDSPALKIVPTITFKVDGNNNIRKSINSNAKISNNTFKVTLSTTPQITWWKGIKIFDRNGQMICLLSTQDADHGPTTSQTLTKKQFDSKIKVEFWKAKAFGVHTHVATKYFKLSDFLNTETRFYWMND